MPRFLSLSKDAPRPIRVVVADDSPFVCRLLTQYLESDPAIRVIRTASDGNEATEVVMNWRPDVLTLDLNMPNMSGLDALRRIMAECPTPVVLVTGVSKRAAIMTKDALALGAVDFVLKYSRDVAVPPDSLRREIIAKVQVASRIKVIRTIPPMGARGKGGERHPSTSSGTGVSGKGQGGHRPSPRFLSLSKDASRLVIIGASTGGPLALKDLLSSLAETENWAMGEACPRHPPTRDVEGRLLSGDVEGRLLSGPSFAVVIVQHMPEGFTGILAAQFDRLFPFPVKEAREGDRLSPGTVLIAPGDRHLLVRADRTVHISMADPVSGQRPSIDVTMQSAAQVFGLNTTGVVLSGMGNDGTQGLLAIKNNCGHTFAQSEGTCVIDSMPVSAMKKKVVERAGTPAELGRWIGCEL